MRSSRKRSNAPIFWLLFGGGGMFASLVGPALVLITGLAVPLAILLPPDAMSYSNMIALFQNIIGKGFLFAVIFLFLWHSAHRIYHSLHEIGIHGGVFAKLCCYGSAFVGTVIAAVSLLSIGF